MSQPPLTLRAPSRLILALVAFVFGFSFAAAFAPLPVAAWACFAIGVYFTWRCVFARVVLGDASLVMHGFVVTRRYDRAAIRSVSIASTGNITGSGAMPVLLLADGSTVGLRCLGGYASSRPMLRAQTAIDLWISHEDQSSTTDSHQA